MSVFKYFQDTKEFDARGKKWPNTIQIKVCKHNNQITIELDLDDITIPIEIRGENAWITIRLNAW